MKRLLFQTPLLRHNPINKSLLFLFIISIYIFAKEELLFFQYIASIVFISFSLFFNISVTKKIRFSRNSIFESYFFLFVVSIFSIFWSVSPYLSTLMSLRILALLLTTFVIQFIYSNKLYLTTFKYAIFSIVVTNLFLYLEIVKFPLPIYKFGRYIGTNSNANVLAITLMISLIFFVPDKNAKLSRVILFFLMLLAIILLVNASGSRKALLFVLLFSILCIFVKVFNKNDIMKYSFLLIIFFSIFYIYFFNNSRLFEIRLLIEPTQARLSKLIDSFYGYGLDQSIELRLYFNNEAKNLILKRPLHGYGGDAFMYYNNTYSHNNYLELLVSFGILGLIFYYSIFYFIIKYLLKSKMRRSDKILIVFTLLLLLILETVSVTFYMRMYIISLNFLFIKIRTSNTI